MFNKSILVDPMFHTFYKFIEIDRLDEIFITAGTYGPFTITRQRMRCQRNHRNGGCARIFFDQTRRCPAVHFWHGKVHNDQVWFLFDRCVYSITPVHRKKSFIAVLFKDETHKFISINVIFNNEYALFLHFVNILRLTVTGNVYNHGIMKILFVADSRSPIAQNWMRYFAAREDEVYLASTFQSDVGFPLARTEFTPAAFSAVKKQTQSPLNATSSLSTGLRTRIRQWFGPLTLPSDAKKLRAFIQEVQPDLIHALRMPYEGILTACALDAGRVSRSIPFIASIWGNDFTFHAPSTPLMGYYTRKTMKAVTALHADCERDIRLAREWGLDPNKPTLVTPGNGGIRTDVFYPPAEPVREPVIINPRGFRAYVRNDSFFKAIPLVLAKVPQAKFICSSMQGEMRATQWVKELNIEHAVTLNPPVTHTEMAEIFRRAQIVVSPSIHDGTPNSLLEGMACGCFPVASDLEPIREWITHRQNGLLVNANDPQSIADAILLGIEREDLRREAAGLNAKIISARAEYEGNMAKVAEFYKLVIGKK